MPLNMEWISEVRLLNNQTKELDQYQELMNDHVIVPLQKNMELLRRNTNQQKFIVVAGAAFVTDTGDKTITSGGWNPTTGTIMRAPVYFPNQSRISEIRYFVRDADAIESVAGALLRVSTTGTETVIGTERTSAGATGDQTLTDQIVTEEVVDNELYAYYLRLTFSAGGNTSIRIYQARVYYYE